MWKMKKRLVSVGTSQLTCSKTGLVKGFGLKSSSRASATVPVRRTALVVATLPKKILREESTLRESSVTPW